MLDSSPTTFLVNKAITGTVSTEVGITDTTNAKVILINFKITNYNFSKNISVDFCGR